MVRHQSDSLHQCTERLRCEYCPYGSVQIPQDWNRYGFCLRERHPRVGSYFPRGPCDFEEATTRYANWPSGLCWRNPNLAFNEITAKNVGPIRWSQQTVPSCQADLMVDVPKQRSNCKQNPEMSHIGQCDRPLEKQSQLQESKRPAHFLNKFNSVKAFIYRGEIALNGLLNRGSPAGKECCLFGVGHRNPQKLESISEAIGAIQQDAKTFTGKNVT